MPSIINDDTICALATAAGGAMATIRISGSEALRVVDQLFTLRSGESICDAASHTAHYGQMHDSAGTPIDDVVATVMRDPHSYTGEDTVEISCHGSRYIIRLILQSLIEHGCRQAYPGEYTQRAFLHGKLDLSQAEAVADLINATNSGTHKMALSQLRGNFSNELADLREQLLRLTSLLELELDFSDHEDLEFADRSELLQLSQSARERISKLAHSFETGNALRNGIAVAIVGKTNVGKSTLLNRLLHDDKAIVSDIHGTTRDVIEDTTQIHGITFRFIDTAGIRQTSDTVEQLGIERTYKKLDEATIVLWLTDAPPSAEESREMAERTEGKKLIAIVNKTDLTSSDYDPTAAFPHREDHDGITILRISAKYDADLASLEEALYQAAAIPEVTENDVIVTNVRHYEALVKAQADIEAVIAGLENGLSGDLLSEDLRSAIDHLAEIVGGAITPDETLGNIFSHFCVGK